MADGVPLALDIALFEQLCFLAQLGQASESVWVRPPSQCPMKLGGGGGGERFVYRKPYLGAQTAWALRTVLIS